MMLRFRTCHSEPKSPLGEESSVARRAAFYLGWILRYAQDDGVGFA